ncbi:MAG TPA: nitroreductase family protein [Gammaproteobacteria bacterium]|nr:nitroreductase family protein [Gammaproteobacteria bacterium]
MTRETNFEIDPTFTQRWSPRAFTGEPLPDEILQAALEAARWSPSGGNTQPWRFIFSRLGSVTWPLFLECLNEGNREWAKNASALLILLSKKDFMSNGQLTESSSYSFDAGAAWMSLALQLTRMGWSSHAMAGIDKQKIRRDFEVPENYNIEVMIAIGKKGDPAQLSPVLQSREQPSLRNPLELIQSEGKFKPDWRS